MDNPIDIHPPTLDELNAIPETVRKYISALEEKVGLLTDNLNRQEDELRRKRYAYWDSRRR
jgi:hypothetical protein